MGQFGTYSVIMCGLLLLFYFSGLTPTNPLLNLLLSPESMSTSSFWITLMASITSVGAAIILGLVFRNVELAVMTAMLPVILALLWGFGEVITVISGFSRVFAVLIFAPLLFKFFIETINFWRGRD